MRGEGRRSAVAPLWPKRRTSTSVVAATTTARPAGGLSAKAAPESAPSAIHRLGGVAGPDSKRRSAMVSAASVTAVASIAPPPTVPSRCHVGESAVVSAAIAASAEASRGQRTTGAAPRIDGAVLASTRRRRTSP
jgi:hypothetical protein